MTNDEANFARLLGEPETSTTVEVEPLQPEEGARLGLLGEASALLEQVSNSVNYAPSVAVEASEPQVDYEERRAAEVAGEEDLVASTSVEAAPPTVEAERVSEAEALRRAFEAHDTFTSANDQFAITG